MLSCKQERKANQQSSEKPVPERDKHVACLKKNTYIYIYIIYTYMDMEARRSAVTPRPQWGAEGDWLRRGG